MKNSSRINQQGIVIWIMNIVIVIEVIFLLIIGGLAAESLYDVFSIPYKERQFQYAVEGNDFFLLVERYHANVQEGYEDERSLQEYYGIAQYYEAASYYKTYLDAGDTGRMEREKAKMDAAQEQMGEWRIVTKTINRQLGLEDM